MIRFPATVADALSALRPGASFNVRGEYYADVEWLDQTQTKPTEAEVNVKIAELDQAAAADVARLDELAGAVGVWINALRNNDLATIDVFVRTRIDADGAVDQATALACLKRIENGIAAIVEILAVTLKRGLD